MRQAGSLFTSASLNTNLRVQNRKLLEAELSLPNVCLICRHVISVATFRGFAFCMISVQGQGHYLGTDPGKQAIQGRAALNVQATQW